MLSGNIINMAEEPQNRNNSLNFISLQMFIVHLLNFSTSCVAPVNNIYTAVWLIADIMQIIQFYDKQDINTEIKLKTIHINMICNKNKNTEHRYTVYIYIQ